MDYFAIIKKAYQITLKHKFLWIFGIFAGGAAGLKSFNFGYSTSGLEWQNHLSNLTNKSGGNFWEAYGTIILLICALISLLAIVVLILNIISQGALIGTVEKIAKNEKVDFHHGFATGTKNFWRVLGVSLIYLLMILASLVILFIPVAVTIVGKMYVLAVIWGILIFFLDLAFWILIGLICPFSFRVVILEKLGIWQSIRESLHFFRDNWQKVLVIYLLTFAIGIGFGIALILAMLIVGGLLLAIGFGVWLASPLGTLVYGLLAGLTFAILVMVISGGYNSFYSAILTLTYLELIKK